MRHHGLAKQHKRRADCVDCADNSVDYADYVGYNVLGMRCFDLHDFHTPKVSGSTPLTTTRHC